MTEHIVLFSGGVASWAAGKRVAERVGPENVKLVFTDTSMEDEDLYRFLREAADNIGSELIWLKDGRDPWEVFFDWSYLGNTRKDPCSKVLKRRKIQTWLNQNCDVEDTVIYLGFSWDESHRLDRAAERWKPWHAEAPLCEEPYLFKLDLFKWLSDEGLEKPRLYELGFSNNNCGGFCIKAGQAHFKHLLDTMPERYAYHEKKEQELREYLNKDVSILRDRTGGQTKSLTLREFRKRQKQGKGFFDQFDGGACSCFDTEED